MSKYKILVYGPSDSAKQKLTSTFGDISSISLDLLDSEILPVGELAAQSFHTAFVSLSLDVPSAIAALRNYMPTLPIVFYGADPNSEDMRSAFIHGATDVLNTKKLTSDNLHSTLRRIANSPFSISHSDSQSKTLNIYMLSRRGQCIEQHLHKNAGFVNAAKGKKLIILRADVICVRESSFWQQDAALMWVQEFGIDHTFILKSCPAKLKLAAIIEQHPGSPDAVENMLPSQLQHLFAALNKIGCIAAACYCSGNSASISDLYHLNQLAALVYYLNKSRIIPLDLVQTNTVLSENLYTKFYKAASVNDLESIIDCIDTAVMNLKRDMPSPCYARMKLSRFIWDFAVAVGFQDEKLTNFRVNHSHISSQRNDIIRLISAIGLHRRGYITHSPLDELIHRIEFNPGISITINQAAQETNFSRSHFCKLFREHTGMSFTEFLTAKRIDSACKLLNKTSMRIDEIAHLVGISNVWYFKKLFTKAKGMSPEEWRETSHSSPGFDQSNPPA